MSSSAATSLHHPQGSVWRRWDPHLHLPGTLFADSYEDTSVEDALDRIAELDPSIEVIGITDYGTTRSFRTAYSAWQSGHGAGIATLFPNVEMRLTTGTVEGSAVNIHLLASAEEVDGLDHFLSLLRFKYKQDTYSAREGELVRLGRRYSGNKSLEHEAALKAGANQFKVNREQLQELLDTHGWARDHLLIAVAGGEGDGTSGLRDPDGAYKATRQELERRSHVIFSGNPKQQTFWHGHGVMTPSELVATYGGKKLVIHGSDAHSVERLGKPVKDRFTWIKGDPSFESLKQACIEPELRSHVGAESPADAESGGRITAVSVSNADDWLMAETVQVNPGLVAIIGPRGSGKTALADLIAVGAGDSSQFVNSKSFVTRASPLLDDSKVSVNWTDGHRSEACLGIDDPREQEVLPSVRYLSQQFVEKLCASDGVTDELISEIERVVFSRWHVEERDGAANFREMLDIRLEIARSRQQEQINGLDYLGYAITEQRILQRSLPDRQSELDERQIKFARIKDEQQSLAGSRDVGLTDRLATVQAQLELRQEAIQKVTRRQRSLRTLEADVAQLRTSGFQRQLETLRDRHSHVDLNESEWSTFLTSFVGDVDSTISAAIEKSTLQRAQLENSVEADITDEAHHRGLPVESLSLTALKSEIGSLQKKLGLDEAKAKRLRILSGEASATVTSIERLKEQIELAGAAKAEIDRLVMERTACYEAYFDALLEEEAELQGLYSPLQELLDNPESSASKLRFAVSRSVDVDGWANWGENLLDLRRGGDFRGKGSLRDLANASLLKAWKYGDGTEVAAAVAAFSTEHTPSIRAQGGALEKSSEDYREWEAEVNKWLYNADHVHLRYTLEYAGVGIEHLSPGTRGIVLLLLYLAVDVEDSIPLLIDQPEENLDPESIYTELVDLFRRASRRRQVIMVTHNANLVVNTEVDQVIVASSESRGEGLLPEVRYLAGGLECPTIREEVCQVLEGGAEAFRERARKLRVSLIA